MITPTTALLSYPKGLHVLGIDVDPLDLQAPIHVLIASTALQRALPGIEGIAGKGGNPFAASRS